MVIRLSKQDKNPVSMFLIGYRTSKFSHVAVIIFLLTLPAKYYAKDGIVLLELIPMLRRST